MTFKVDSGFMDNVESLIYFNDNNNNYCTLLEIHFTTLDPNDVRKLYIMENKALQKVSLPRRFLYSDTHGIK